MIHSRLASSNTQDTHTHSRAPYLSFGTGKAEKERDVHYKLIENQLMDNFFFRKQKSKSRLSLDVCFREVKLIIGLAIENVTNDAKSRRWMIMRTNNKKKTMPFTFFHFSARISSIFSQSTVST